MLINVFNQNRKGLFALKGFKQNVKVLKLKCMYIKYKGIVTFCFKIRIPMIEKKNLNSLCRI